MKDVKEFLALVRAREQAFEREDVQEVLRLEPLLLGAPPLLRALASPEADPLPEEELDQMLRRLQGALGISDADLAELWDHPAVRADQPAPPTAAAAPGRGFVPAQLARAEQAFDSVVQVLVRLVGPMVACAATQDLEVGESQDHRLVCSVQAHPLEDGRQELEIGIVLKVEQASEYQVRVCLQQDGALDSPVLREDWVPLPASGRATLYWTIPWQDPPPVLRCGPVHRRAGGTP